MFLKSKKVDNKEIDDLEQITNEAMEIAIRTVQVQETSTVFDIYKNLYTTGVMEKEDFVRSTRKLLNELNYYETDD